MFNPTSCPRKLMLNIEHPPVGGGKTAIMLGVQAHEEFAKYCESDVGSVRELANAVEQSMIRRLVAKAAFKLGASATLGVESGRQKQRQKEIKGELATKLRLLGIPYTRIESVIRELVEGLKNV